jgi:hypothetical protein
MMIAVPGGLVKRLGWGAGMPLWLQERNGSDPWAQKIKA